jgi:hypothetical protein
MKHFLPMLPTDLLLPSLDILRLDSFYQMPNKH